MERTLKLVVEYDGTHFAGWQVQPDQRTVQGEIEKALEQILRHPLRVTAAGRTDAGVHAAGQAASFTTPNETPCDRMLRSLNGVLPKDISIVSAEEMHEGFNARFDATARTYRYTLSTRRLSIGRDYAWHVRCGLSRELLEQAVLPMKHLCSIEGFSKKNDDDDYSTIIHSCFWTFEGHLMTLEISAIRFFQHAVRGIVGSAVEVGRGKEKPDLLARILETGDRSLAGPLAPAKGLCLVRVDYPEKEES